MKFKLRTNTRNDLVNAIATQLERSYMYQCCLNCEHFKEKTEMCLLANQRPPARVIVYGCNSWQDLDSIPF